MGMISNGQENYHPHPIGEAKQPHNHGTVALDQVLSAGYGTQLTVVQ